MILLAGFHTHTHTFQFVLFHGIYSTEKMTRNLLEEKKVLFRLQYKPAKKKKKANQQISHIYERKLNLLAISNSIFKGIDQAKTKLQIQLH